MTERRFGLRLRVLATLTGAAMLSGALLGILLLLRARDEVARRHVASVRLELRSVASSIMSACAGAAPCERQAALAAGLNWKSGSRCAPPARDGVRVLVCEEVTGGTLRRMVIAFKARTTSNSIRLRATKNCCVNTAKWSPSSPRVAT